MKKNLLGWLAMATMLVGTGCSSDDVVNDYSPENAIEFGTYLGRDAQGRATITDATSLQTTGFGVFAYLNASGTYTNANFMKNTQVSTSSWTYGPTKYWPNDNTNKLSFFAYGPYGDENIDNVNDAGADNTITYTVDGDIAKQTDFVVAAPILNKGQGDFSTSNGKVKFTFAHMLSRIAFSAKKSNADAATVTINWINLTGNFFTTGTVDMSANAPAIVGTGTATEQTYTFTKGEEFNTAEAELETTADNLTTGDTKYLMVIPSEINDYTITVNYTVSYSDGSDPVTSTITSSPIRISFTAGNAYLFNLDVKLNAIEFAQPIVTGWSDSTTPVVPSF